MPPEHDRALRRGLDAWIKNWRNYASRHPEAAEDQAWRETEYQQMVELLNKRATLPDSITCLHCGKTSYNPNDIREKYCGYCHRFSTE